MSATQGLQMCPAPVLGLGDDFEMLGVDAGRVEAEVV